MATWVDKHFIFTHKKIKICSVCSWETYESPTCMTDVFENLHLMDKVGLHDGSSAATARKTPQTCESRSLSLWSWQSLFRVLSLCGAYIYLCRSEGEMYNLGLNPSKLLVGPCETIASWIAARSENDSLRGPRLDLSPSCLRLFKAWVMLRALRQHSHWLSLTHVHFPVSLTRF